MQGALFASGIAGVDFARDIDTGFLNRLALTPVRGSALLLGQIGGALGIGTIQAFIYLGVGLAAGVHIASGVGGRGADPRLRDPDRRRLRDARVSGSRCAPARARACSRSSRCSSSCC